MSGEYNAFWTIICGVFFGGILFGFLFGSTNNGYYIAVCDSKHMVVEWSKQTNYLGPLSSIVYCKDIVQAPKCEQFDDKEICIVKTNIK